MSIDIQPQQTTEAPAVETKKKHRIPKKAWGYIAVGVVCTIIGTTAGTTEYVEVEKQVEVVKEVKVEVPTIPKDCEYFSNAADNLNDINARGFGLVADILGAASMLDMAGMSASTDELEQLRLNEKDPASLVYLALQDKCLHP